MSERSITVTHNGIDYVASVAKVEYTRLGAEDHGIFTASIGFVSGAWHQSMGDYCLDEPLRDADGSFLRREGTAYGLDHVMRLLWVFGVSKWEDIQGQSALTLRKDPFGLIQGVANLHDESRVFVPREHADEWLARATAAGGCGMNQVAAQRLLRERRRRHLAALRARRSAAGTGQGLVLRINEPPLPETMAYLRSLYGPNVTVVVDTTTEATA